MYNNVEKVFFTKNIFTILRLLTNKLAINSLIIAITQTTRKNTCNRYYCNRRKV